MKSTLSRNASEPLSKTAQFSPASSVLRTVPLRPTTHPLRLSKKSAATRNWLVPAVCASQVAPRSAVLLRVPKEDTPRPAPPSMRWTPAIHSPDLSDAGSQVAPPSVDR